MSMPTTPRTWLSFAAGLSVPRPPRPATWTWLLALPLSLAIGCVAGGAGALRDLSASRASMASAVLEADRHVEIVALAETLAAYDESIPGKWGGHMRPGGDTVVTKGEVSVPLADRSPRAGTVPSPRAFALQGERAVPYVSGASVEWPCRHLAATLATGPLASRLQVGSLGAPGSPGEWADVTDREAVRSTCAPLDYGDRVQVRVRP